MNAGRPPARRPPTRHTGAPLWLRLSALGLGVLLLFWLPVEDLDVRGVIGFAAAISALAAAFFLSIGSRQAGGVGNGMPVGRCAVRDKHGLAFSLAGLLAGLAIAPLAVALMVFKSGLHGHPSPDFTPEQVLSVFTRTPIFTAAGFLIGLGIGLYRRAG